MPGDGAFLREVMDREIRLLDPGVRRSAAEVEGLLHPDFVEFGSSGRQWTRNEMLSAIGGELTGDEPPATYDMRAVRLADSVVHVTYVSVHANRHVRRSSLWCGSEDGEWGLYFHQGTVIPATE